jgi:two-component system cell cycle sensor histidine kinase/response regulator CckA
VSDEAISKIEEAEAKYRGIFENAIEGIYQSTPDGQYLTVNPALARMYGYQDPVEMLRGVSDIGNQIYVDPSFRARFQRQIETAGAVHGLEYQVRRRDGGIIWISETARVVRDANGAARYYEGFIEDVTARKEAEAENARMEKEALHLQKMDAIGTLAGGMAHDFNNVLCAILGYTELALLDPQIKGATRDNLDLALRSSERAAALIKRILSFARPTDSDKRPIKITPVVKEAIKLLQATLPSSVAIHLTLETEDDVILADPTELHQVIMNLGVNAKHALSEKGGNLSYVISLTEFDESTATIKKVAPGPFVHLAVSDDGHGMTREVRERIFDPFFTTKPAGRGTGLGLTFVQKIVTRSQGCVEVESDPGKGAAFHLYFPKSTAAPEPITTDKSQALQGKREQILVVDDEVVLLSMIQQRLRKLNYRVITRADSVDVLETLKANPRKFDLVITDHTMPSLQGAELAELLGEIRPDLPVILMTGLSAPPDMSASKYASRRRVIAKPVDFAQLSVKMRELLDH